VRLSNAAREASARFSADAHVTTLQQVLFGAHAA